MTQIINFLTSQQYLNASYIIITDEPRYSLQKMLLGDYAPSYNIHPSGLQKSTWGCGKSPRGQIVHATRINSYESICSENKSKKPKWNQIETTQNPVINCPKCLKQIEKDGLNLAGCIHVFS
jgi:hypothetical protein